jgi:RNA polymerase sigma factor (sigma-70 family)
MPVPSLSHVLRHLRTLSEAQATRDMSDGELLERFRVHREETAFALLVQRHGPMVLGVCRRLLADAHAAEDAFQATFLVLVRKAASIRKRDSVASWLHGVARRIAVKARQRTARNHALERRSLTMPRAEAINDYTWHELRAILDEELEQLPEKYRTPLVLCGLEGKTHEQAARELGCPKSSLSSRLVRARELLRDRLTRRGITVSAATLAAVLTEEASAAVPALLTIATVRAAMQKTAEVITANVAALTREGMQAIGATKAKAGWALMLTATLLAAGMGAVLGHQTSTDNPLPERKDASPADQPDAENRKSRTDLHGDPLPEGALVRLGTVRLRHPGALSAKLAFLPDGKIITSGDDGLIRLWDPATGKELHSWQWTQPGRIGSMALSADGRLVAVSDHKGTYLRDLVSGKEVRRIRSEASFDPLAFSPDGKLLAGGVGYRPGADGKPTFPIVLVDAQTGKELRTLLGHERAAHSLVFTPDGRTLIAHDSDRHTIRFWDPATGKEQRRLQVQQNDRLRTLALSRDGKVLAGAGSRFLPATRAYEAAVWLWDAVSGKELRQLPGKGDGVSGLAFSTDGKLLASRDYETLRFWDIATGKELRRIEGEEAASAGMAFAPDGKVLATIAWQTIRLWDVDTGKQLGKREAHTGSVSTMAYSPDGKLLASGSSEDATVRVWDATTGKLLHRLQGHKSYVREVAFAPDGKTVISGGADNAIRFSDAVTGKEIRTLNVLPEHDPEHGKWGHQILAMRLSADGTTVYARSMGFDKEGQYTLSAWDVATGKRQFQRLEDTGSSDNFGAFSPDGRFFVSENGSVTDVATVKRVYSLSGMERVYNLPVFSPSGKLVAFVRRDQPLGTDVNVYSYSIRLLELATGKEYRAWTVQEFIECLAFSPDGRVLVSGSSEAIRLWNVATGQELLRRSGHGVNVSSLSFAPDGRTLASGLRDTTVLVWALAPESWHAGLPTKDLSAENLTAFWANLADGNAAKGQAAVWTLAASPRDSVPFLAKHLRPAVLPDNEQLARWIADLDSAAFTDRENATRELERQAELAEPLLRKALSGDPSPEVRRRIETLLSKLQRPVKPAGVLRSLRAIEVLEHIATPEARVLLRKLAGGAPEAHLTREAKAALERLHRQQSHR